MVITSYQLVLNSSFSRLSLPFLPTSSSTSRLVSRLLPSPRPSPGSCYRPSGASWWPRSSPAPPGVQVAPREATRTKWPQILLHTNHAKQGYLEISTRCIQVLTAFCNTHPICSAQIFDTRAVGHQGIRIHQFQ